MKDDAINTDLGDAAETHDVTEPTTAEEDEKARRLSRRGFLVGSGAAALAAAGCSSTVVGSGGGAAPTPSAPAEPEPAASMAKEVFRSPAQGAAKDYYQAYAEPRALYSREATVSETLRVESANNSVRYDTFVNSFQTRTYNGEVPGPTLRVYPGDKLDLTVINDLPPNDDPGCGPNCGHDDANTPGCFNTTNLHTHGLHVSPSTGADGVSSDDVFVVIPPANDPYCSDPSTRDYCIWLPTFHAPGTHWYHAHRHGSTGIQVVNGLAGALIVEDPPGQEVPVDGEKILLMQENIFKPDGSPADPADVYRCNPGNQLYDSRFLLNNVFQPTFTMRPNEIQRWRFINGTATPAGLTVLSLVDTSTNQAVEWYLIAVDGIYFYGNDPQPNTGQTLAPGNRADFLVQLPAGTYEIVKGASGGGASVQQTLATVVVEGDPYPDQPLPSLPGLEYRPDYLTPISDEEIQNTPTQNFEFQVPPGGCGGPTTGDPVPANFKINGLRFGEPGAEVTVQLNTAELWNLANSSGADHPFHIHVNPFQVEGDLIDPNGDNVPENWRWWDTIAIPAGTTTAAPLKTRHRFTDYNGRYVFHCHILIHEDLGMMFEVQVDGDGVGPCEPLGDS